MKDISEEPSIVDKAQPLADNTPWFGIQLFGLRQKVLVDFLKEKDIETFVPMQNVVFVDRQGKRRHELRPVVSNLIFVKKSLRQQAMAELITHCQYKMSVITRDRTTRDYYEIPAKQMFEFQAMCNPEIEMRKYLNAEEARLKVGTPVLVSHGPLKGLTGRLVRQNHKYFLLKEVPGLGVMLKVSRWCCQPIES